MEIQDSRVEKLLDEVISQTGETPSQAIASALEDRLERVRKAKAAESLYEDILEISRQCRELPESDSRPYSEILGYEPQPQGRFT